MLNLVAIIKNIILGRSWPVYIWGQNLLLWSGLTHCIGYFWDYHDVCTFSWYYTASTCLSSDFPGTLSKVVFFGEGWIAPCHLKLCWWFEQLHLPFWKVGEKNSIWSPWKISNMSAMSLLWKSVHLSASQRPICVRQFSVRETFDLNKNMDNPLDFVLMGSYCPKSRGSRAGNTGLERCVCRKLSKEAVGKFSGEGKPDREMSMRAQALSETHRIPGV